MFCPILGRRLRLAHGGSMSHENAPTQHQGTRFRQKNAGFTLIELLVVISIISLLIAILLPVLSAVKKSAVQTQCLSNLRQVSTGMHAYLVDVKEIFPPHSRTFDGLAAGSQASDRPEDRYAFWATDMFDYMNGEYEAFRCPTLSSGTQTDFGVEWNWAFDNHHLGYGYNAYFLGIAPHATTINFPPIPGF
ncbi:MAG: type II secretion system protein, partial [Phycisphaerales bacterium JB063]